MKTTYVIKAKTNWDSPREFIYNDEEQMNKDYPYIVKDEDLCEFKKFKRITIDEEIV